MLGSQARVLNDHFFVVVPQQLLVCIAIDVLLGHSRPQVKQLLGFVKGLKHPLLLEVIIHVLRRPLLHLAVNYSLFV